LGEDLEQKRKEKDCLSLSFSCYENLEWHEQWPANGGIYVSISSASFTALALGILVQQQFYGLGFLPIEHNLG
jgi:hypothetical protein